MNVWRTNVLIQICAGLLANILRILFKNSFLSATLGKIHILKIINEKQTIFFGKSVNVFSPKYCF